ncbi:hypothetical protein [Streptomyces sp. NRRL F-5126]|nr:hypothetical protein [Streptomyces sp. NRRL F-5126]
MITSWTRSRAPSTTVHGSWFVYAVWPLIAIALAVFAVRRRDV